MFLYDGAIVPDPEGIITGGHQNSTARTVAVYEGEPINARALVAMFAQIIANNRAGGWRKPLLTLFYYFPYSTYGGHYPPLLILLSINLITT